MQVVEQNLPRETTSGPSLLNAKPYRADEQGSTAAGARPWCLQRFAGTPCLHDYVEDPHEAKSRLLRARRLRCCGVRMRRRATGDIGSHHGGDRGVLVSDRGRTESYRAGLVDDSRERACSDNRRRLGHRATRGHFGPNDDGNGATCADASTSGWRGRPRLHAGSGPGRQLDAVGGAKAGLYGVLGRVVRNVPPGTTRHRCGRIGLPR